MLSVEISKKLQKVSIRNFVLSYGFSMVLVSVFIGFSVGTPNFLTISNIMNMMHNAASILILASGLVLVVMTGKLDISIGSIGFVSAALGSVLMIRHDVPIIMAMLVIIVAGLSCGALNGFVVVVLKVNPFITTLGTMIALRGIALQIISGRVVTMTGTLRRIGNARIGPVFIDIFISLAIVFFIHLLHSRTRFGRYVLAIGSKAEVAERMGVRVKRVTFITFILSGLFASIGGIFSMLQLGTVTLHMGIGLEFTAIAAIVIGGISLFGGEGSIIPGYLLGFYTLVIIENGLNHLGASPYVYPFVRGGLIFIAMYVDSLRSKSKISLK